MHVTGHPDIVLVRHKKIIFVHGYFWHVHHCRYGQVKPATNSKLWQYKRQSNVERDRKNTKELKKLGWKILVVWECEIKKIERLKKKISDFLKE
jgi:DNA mismatch endonuclease, patch repair protein